MPTKAKRLLWIVNHKTLVRAEVPIFRDLGYEVFIPKIIPPPLPFQSGIVTYDYDATLSIPRRDLEILNSHAFFGELDLYRPWSPTVRSIINEHFSVAVSSISAFISPLNEAILHFDGLVLARAFGLTRPKTYKALIDWLGRPEMIDAAAARGSRYAFVQGYPNIAEIEPAGLVANAYTVRIAVADEFFQFENSWVGRDGSAIMVCPGIEKDGYYRGVYQGLKRDFEGIPHKIFGKQYAKIDDGAILPYLSDSELVDLYRQAPVFIYPSTEPRHIHYSPIEAMIVGTPVLYMRGSLSDIIAGEGDMPGRCDDVVEMKQKALRLLQGDRLLAEQIRSSQSLIVDTFRVGLAREQWAAVLP